MLSQLRSALRPHNLIICTPAQLRASSIAKLPPQQCRINDPQRSPPNYLGQPAQKTNLGKPDGVAIGRAPIGGGRDANGLSGRSAPRSSTGAASERFAQGPPFAARTP